MIWFLMSNQVMWLPSVLLRKVCVIRPCDKSLCIQSSTIVIKDHVLDSFTAHMMMHDGRTPSCNASTATAATACNDASCFEQTETRMIASDLLS